MIVCGINIGHLSSLTLIENGKIIYYNEETKTSRKKIISGIPYNCIDQIKNYKLDYIYATSYDWGKVELTNLKHYLFFKKILKKGQEVHCLFKPHHLSHLYKAYVDSKFKKARVFVIDGRGSNWGPGFEVCSIYDIEGSKINCVYKELYTPTKSTKEYSFNEAGVNKNTLIEVTDQIGLGAFYAFISMKFGFANGEGKFMGFQSYGKVDNDLLNNLNKNLTLEKIKQLPVNVNSAKTYQIYFENRYQELVKKFKSPNMVFTGGTALNVVNNYKLKKLFPKTKMYFEPLCGDEGNSIGAAYYHYIINNKKINPTENIFLGGQIKINKSLLKNEYLQSNVITKDIINILKKGDVVGLIQGRTEAGPRALGNRSLLLDPTIKEAKEKMNSIKKRENFRPFACSILEEKFSRFFYVEDKDSSPFMMIAPQAKKETKNTASSIVHVDGTCRVQTVNKKNNFQLYELLKNYKIPMLMNTSFNLAGFPIVDTFKDILYTLRNSKLKYVYFSDEKKLLIKND
tara:strand:+ start:2781 stop:4322 length:1542 start_codon:yes stop_codon:yes gene_type:complete